MKSIEQLLRDDAQALAVESKQILAETEQAVIASMKRDRPYTNYMIGSTIIAGIVLASAVWWYGSSSSAQVSVKGNDKEHIVHITNTDPIPVDDKSDRPSHTNVRQKIQAVMTDSTQSRMNMSIDQDGFYAEYERIYAKATEQIDINKYEAVEQFLGLARLCDRRSKTELKREVLQKALEVARQTNDQALIIRVHRAVDTH